jgi:hypothetical protein
VVNIPSTHKTVHPILPSGKESSYQFNLIESRLQIAPSKTPIRGSFPQPPIFYVAMLP